MKINLLKLFSNFGSEALPSISYFQATQIKPFKMNVFDSEALPALSYFQARQVKQTAWKCQLEITPGLKIPINSFVKVNITSHIKLNCQFSEEYINPLTSTDDVSHPKYNGWKSSLSVERVKTRCNSYN